MSRKEEIFFRMSGLSPANAPNTVYIGDTQPQHFQECVEEIMEEYCRIANESLKNEHNEFIKKETRSLVCMSPREFYKLFKERFTKNDRLYYKLYDEDGSKKIDIKEDGRYKNDFQSYLEYLKDNFSRLKVVQFFFWHFPFALPFTDLQAHTHITGKSGIGKTELVKHIINQLLQLDQDDCIVLLDPHGDIARQVVKFKSASKRHIAYFNPLFSVDNFPCINPFDVSLADDYETDKYTQEIKKIFDELFKRSGVSLQMDTVVSPCISVLLKKGNSSLYELMQFMDDTKNKNLVEIGKKISTNPIHKDYFENHFYDPDYSKTKRSMKTRIQSLLNSTLFFKITCNKSTFNLEKELNRKNLLIFNLSKNDLGTETSEVLGRLIITMIQTIALKRAKIERWQRKSIFCLIDECQNFISESLKLILEEARKFGLFLYLIHQRTKQIDPDLMDSIFSCSWNKFVGMNSVKVLPAFASEIQMDLERLLNLKKGQFALKSGERPSFIFSVPSNLADERGSITEQEWETKRKPAIESEYYKMEKRFPKDEELSLEDIARRRNLEQNQNYGHSKKDPLKPKYGL